MPASGRRPRVGLAEGEPGRDSIRAALGERYELVSSLAEGAQVWLLGPQELARDGVHAVRASRLRGDVPCIAVTPDDTGALLLRDCFRSGAAEVLLAAEVESALPAAVARAIERAGVEAAREGESSRLAIELGKRARGLEAALLAIRGAYDETLTALVTALDCRERETACHSQRVAAYSIYLGELLGVEGDALEDLYRGALLHDIGKIGIPDAILLKPGPLSPEEWTVMRGHADLGAQIARRIGFLEGAAVVPAAHHEAWDGSGYPLGLAGDTIPLHARIFAVADTYDALRSERPYKAAWEHAAAIERIREVSETRLDPAIVECFVSLREATLSRLARAAEDAGTYADTLGTCRAVAAGLGGPEA